METLEKVIGLLQSPDINVSVSKTEQIAKSKGITSIEQAALVLFSYMKENDTLFNYNFLEFESKKGKVTVGGTIPIYNSNELCSYLNTAGIS